MSVIRRLVRKGGSSNRWLAALVARKPKMVAAVATSPALAHADAPVHLHSTDGMIWILGALCAGIAAVALFGRS